MVRASNFILMMPLVYAEETRRYMVGNVYFLHLHKRPRTAGDPYILTKYM